MYNNADHDADRASKQKEREDRREQQLRCEHDFHYYLENGRTIGRCPHCRFTKVVSEKRTPDMRIKPLVRDVEDTHA